MMMSDKQAFVLENLDRVQPLLYKVAVRRPTRRYQLDGWECTRQVVGLVVRQRIAERSDGRLERRAR